MLYLAVYFVGFPFLFMYNILSTMFTSIGESRIPLWLLIFSSVLNIFYGPLDGGGLELGVFGAALAHSIAQGISAVFSLLIFFIGCDSIKVPLNGLTGRASFNASNCRSFGSSAVHGVNRYDDCTGSCESVRYTGTCRIFGNDESRKCFFTDICIHWKCSSPFVSQNLGAGKEDRIKKGYHAALVLDVFCSTCFYSY